MTIEEVVKHLEKLGFYKVSVEGPYKLKMLNDDRNITINIEEDFSQMTAKDEEIVKERLKQLGYLD